MTVKQGVELLGRARQHDVLAQKTIAERALGERLGERPRNAESLTQQYDVAVVSEALARVLELLG